jgi:hypothetical protein
MALDLLASMEDLILRALAFLARAARLPASLFLMILACLARIALALRTFLALRAALWLKLLTLLAWAMRLA